jgi:hypothetical protein
MSRPSSDTTRDADKPSRDKPMAPGDDAPAGTPGTGENVCPRCGGSGRIGGSSCPECAGTGKVTQGIGGA